MRCAKFEFGAEKMSNHLVSHRFRPILQIPARNPARRRSGLSPVLAAPLGKKPTVRLGLVEKMGKRFPNARFDTSFHPESVGKMAIWALLFFSCLTGDYPLAIT
jgi:hypothetical protein